MWHVAVESWQWIHQVAAPCNVIRGSGMTCNWICPVAAPWNVIRSSGIMTLNSLGGSTLQCGRWFWDNMLLNSPERPPYWNSTSGFDFDQITSHHSRHVILHQSPKFYPNRTTIGRKKITSCRFSRWRISAIWDFKDPIKKPNYRTFYRSSIDTIALNNA